MDIVVRLRSGRKHCTKDMQQRGVQVVAIAEPIMTCDAPLYMAPMRGTWWFFSFFRVLIEQMPSYPEVAEASEAQDLRRIFWSAVKTVGDTEKVRRFSWTVGGAARSDPVFPTGTKGLENWQICREGRRITRGVIGLK